MNRLTLAGVVLVLFLPALALALIQYIESSYPSAPPISVCIDDIQGDAPLSMRSPPADHAQQGAGVSPVADPSCSRAGTPPPLPSDSVDH